MKLAIEDWISNQNFENDINDLFSESFICYKAGAYRAAFIFSYLGFLTILKLRILNSTCPTGIPSGMWSSLQNDLLNEDSWEKKTFESTQNSTRQIFIISEDIRNQIKYWKNRRNDCVHFKNNIVNHSLVESFWGFLKTYLSKLVVSGSKESLHGKIANHFNPAFTNPGTDFSHLVKEISTSVSNPDLINFFNDISNVFNRVEDEFKFFNDVYLLCNVSVQNKLSEYFLKTENNLLLLWLLRQYPERIHILNGKDSRIRRLWYNVLFKHNFNDFPVYCTLLRNGMIPNEQIEESIKKCLNRNTKNIPTDDEFSELQKHNYTTLLKKFIFSKYRNTDWLNEFSDIIKFYLTKTEITTDEAVVLNKIFNRSKWPWSLENRLKDLFDESPDKRDRIKSLLDNENKEIGVHFTPLL